jgi:HEPN domain-containing protein
MSSDPPLDLYEFRRWRGEADRALEGARLQAGGGLHNWACFSAEQASQLAVKGLLHGLGRGPWGHDLDQLGAMVGDAGVRLPESITDAMHRLTRHYIPARYPDAHPGGEPGEHYGAADADQAMTDARAIIEFVDHTWREVGGDQGG